ncbi:hypothetical protein [Polyangium mundeleinium]|uniref:Sialidase domain-containing protein n=1 Tax=Polyangium mundeleinium TaxID=2995306 RepID=A0ABT5F0L9_9BACT|nr:hypothetical protein [Polyangium mundeleinium]MDC0747620.1 hypothetical protein [Polyangium mundeleinium]
MSTTSPQIQFHRRSWWGFEVHLNQRAVDVLTTLEGIIAEVVGNFLPRPLSILMDLYIRVRHRRIERASRGQGVRLVSPWTHPLMLTPRPLNPSPMGDTALRWSVSESGAWCPPELFPDHHSATSPALAASGDQLICVQRGIGQDEGLSWMAYGPETGWSDVTRIGTQASRASPALAAFNNQIHCVYRGSGNDPRLYWTIFNGSGWTPGQPLPHDMHSPSSPALAVFHGELVCVFTRQGFMPNPLINPLAFTTFNGTSWRQPRELPHNISSLNNMAAPTGPALAPIVDRLVCAYQGQSGRLLWTTFSGHTWEPPQQIGSAGTPNTPALVNFLGNVHCIHRGTSGNVLWSSTFNRSSWSEWQDTGLRSAAEPALVVYRDKNVDASVRDQLMSVFRGQ